MAGVARANYSAYMDHRAKTRPLILAVAIASIEVVKVLAGWSGSPSVVQWVLAVLVFGGVVAPTAVDTGQKKRY